MTRPTGLENKLSVAGTTGLEPATSRVTSEGSNQLSYVPTMFVSPSQILPSSEREKDDC